MQSTHIPDLMVLAWENGDGHAGLDLKDPVVNLHLASASLEVEGWLCCWEECIKKGKG